MFIIKWLCCTWWSCCCNIVKIFKLPIRPWSKIFCQFSNKNCYLSSTFFAIWKSSKFSHHCPNFHFLCIHLFACYLKLIKISTKSRTNRLTKIIYQWTINMITKYLPWFLCFITYCFIKTTSKNIENTWLIKN